jgi:outer membrane lipoprotein SlyB
MWSWFWIACKITWRESQAKYPAKAKNESKITVSSLNGLSTHSIKPMIFPSVSAGVLAGCGLGATSAFGLGTRRLTGATFAGALAGALTAVFAGTFLAVTIRPHTKI